MFMFMFKLHTTIILIKVIVLIDKKNNR